MRLWFLLFLVPGAAGAQDAIFKCVDSDGGVSYQNTACPSGASVAGIREYTPLTPQEIRQADWDRQNRESVAAQKRALAEQRARLAARAQGNRPVVAHRSQRARCLAAREARDNARKRAPMWRPVDYLDPFDEKVRQACNGLW